MMAEGFMKSGAKVYIAGRRKDVLQKTADEISGTSGKIVPYGLDFFVSPLSDYQIGYGCN
jgi:NADP-dependent 3-hydroxy acid dehydrogenase YdfG